MPQGKKNKEEGTEIALTVCKVPSEESTVEHEMCVACEVQDEEHHAQDSQHGIDVQRRAYVKFYDSDDEGDE